MALGSCMRGKLGPPHLRLALLLLVPFQLLNVGAANATSTPLGHFIIDFRLSCSFSHKCQLLWLISRASVRVLAPLACLPALSRTFSVAFPRFLVLRPRFLALRPRFLALRPRFLALRPRFLTLRSLFGIQALLWLRLFKNNGCIQLEQVRSTSNLLE
jgi:hypothetical protein